MNEQLNKPKRFGEILDTAFQLTKRYFSQFFLITLIVVGPLYLLHGIFLLLSGKNLISEADSGEGWLDRFVIRFDENVEMNTQGDTADILIGTPSFVLYAVAFAAILFAVHQLKKNEEFTVGKVLKQAFSRFWQILGSSLLFGLIIFGMIAGAIIFVTIFGLVSAVGSITASIIMVIVLLLGVGLVMAYFLTRWGLFLGVTAFEDNVPGLGRSWNLTRGHAWKTLGVFLVFVLIFLCINIGIDIIFLPMTGQSVLYNIVVHLIQLFTNTIFAVGYAIVYFDLKSRHDGDDVRDMLDDYETADNES